MATYQIVIDAGVAFRQILKEILIEGPSPSLSKPKGSLVIKSKP
jgi:hypothetical protein